MSNHDNQPLDTLGRRLPYRETDGQIDDMLRLITAQALAQAPQRQRARRQSLRRLAIATSAAAALALAATIALRLTAQGGSSHYNDVMRSQSVDELLAQMDDDDVITEDAFMQSVVQTDF